MKVTVPCCLVVCALVATLVNVAFFLKLRRGTPQTGYLVPMLERPRHVTSRHSDSPRSADDGPASGGGADDNIPPSSATPSGGADKHHAAPIKHRSKRRRSPRPTQPLDRGASNFVNLTYDAALLQWEALVKAPLKQEIEQSSNKFTDYEEASHHGVALPEVEDDSGSQAQPPAAPTACDPEDYGFTTEKDQACETYLSDTRNWQSIKSMSSVLNTGRTIKFKVYLRHLGAKAVLKVSQKKFVLEPASEVMAYHMDRELGLFRVPPTVWMPVPVDYIRAAAAAVDTFYVQWVDGFVLKYRDSRHLLSTVNGVRCVNVSLQLWINNVRDADDTDLRPVPHTRRKLECRSPSSAAPASPEDVFGPAEQHVLGELSDMAVFDLVVGNQDRWFGHNSFVAQGRPGGALPSRYIYIDQGSSFYRSTTPEENLYAAIMKKSGGGGGGGDADEGSASGSSGNTLADWQTMPHRPRRCRFRAATADAILKAGDDDGHHFCNLVRKRLPGGLFHVANKELMKAACARLSKLGKKIRDCESFCGSAAVRSF